MLVNLLAYTTQAELESQQFSYWDIYDRARQHSHILIGFVCRGKSNRDEVYLGVQDKTAKASYLVGDRAIVVALMSEPSDTPSSQMAAADSKQQQPETKTNAQ